MQRIWFDQSVCRGAMVHYYLIEESPEAGEKRYGIEVRYGNETETIPDITTSRQSAVTLLAALARGSATPVTVREVVEDWLNR